MSVSHLGLGFSVEKFRSILFAKTGIFSETIIPSFENRLCILQ